MTAERGLRYFPIALFASVMGLSGVTMALKHAENLYGFKHVTSTIFLILTTLLFFVNALILLYRMIRHRDEVKLDFNHPVKMNFFAAISISMLLIATAFLEISNPISFSFWILGAILQAILTLVILSKLIWTFSFTIEQFNPAWFIPIVGNIVVPLAGSSHVAPDINWIFFSTGIVFSIIYTTVFFNRIFFHPPLPPMLLPTFFILMAPPAIGFVSYVKLSGGIDTFAYILYGTAFVIGLLLLFQIKRFIQIPFFVSWWAFLFPSAAMTIATVEMFLDHGRPMYEVLFIIQVFGLLFLVIFLLGKTIQLALQKKLCVKG